MVLEVGYVECELCGDQFPEDEVRRDDETVCQECYTQRGIDRAEAKYDLD